MSNSVLQPILLRSSTPAPNEKVLKYLEGMNRDSVNITPPASMIGGEGITRSKTPKPDRKGWEKSSVGGGGSKLYNSSPKGSRAAQQLDDLAGSEVSYGKMRGAANNGALVQNGHTNGDHGDADSNVQDGLRSELGTVLPMREPGPDDLPGPRYESFDSGPSFGNFGPMPVEYPYTTWQPSWGPQKEPPDSQSAVPWGTAGALTPGYAKIPLPESTIGGAGGGGATSVQIGVESPSSPRSKAATANQGKGRSTPSRSGMPNDADRPLSPQSQSIKTRMTGRTQGTNYPPLPPSAMGETQTQMGPDGPSSPKSRSHMYRALSKAPSVSPSDSPSQYRYKAAKTPTPLSPPMSPVKSMPGSVMSGGGTNAQNRPFSPYRHAATQEDLLHAAIRGRAMVPVVEDKEPSQASRVESRGGGGSKLSVGSAKMMHESRVGGSKSDLRAEYVGAEGGGGNLTPVPSRPHSPDQLNPEEERIVRDTLTARTPRTSMYAASAADARPLEEDEAANSHFHDMDLCILLQQENDSSVHEVVKKALRKAIRQRVKRLGMKYDPESIKQYRKSFHDHDPSVHLGEDYQVEVTEEAPAWAKEILRGMQAMQIRVDSLAPRLDDLSRSMHMDHYATGNSPGTQTVNIQTQRTGTMAESMYAPQEEEINEEDYDDEQRTQTQTPINPRRGYGKYANGEYTDGETRTHGPISDLTAEEGRDDSPGQQFLEEELYKLRQKPASQSGRSHRTWEVARDDDQDGEGEGEYDEDGMMMEDDGENEEGHGGSGLPTIPDTNAGGGYTRATSPPLPPIPQDVVSVNNQVWQQHAGDYSGEQAPLAPWQRIHQRLLSWAIVWPMTELDQALNSTTRGQQVDEVALSIWSTQTYKRYVRARMTDQPKGVVDRLFVPPNVADAISNAVFNGRHGDACGMLKDLWAPFGLEGMPRLLVVLAKHRSDANHWVVHRFSLPDGALTTYDSYPERTLPDGRPLGWWFAIRVAWPNAIYPSPDHLMQKMVRLHRPMQLGIDNSVAAGGIWRNILMGSRAERSLDLERLRDLINTEVKNLRQRKHMGKLSISAPRPNWEDMN